jgi:hypothetical protein
VDAVVRAWLGFAALGAGLIHVALVLGSPFGIGMPLLLIGAAEFAWGVFAIARPELPVPRVVRIGALIPLLGWAVVLGLTAGNLTTGLRVLPMLVASLFDLVLAFAITALLRRVPERALRPLPAGRYLLGVAAGALLVGALTTPALAATEAVESGIPGGGVPVDPHGH